MKFWQQFPKKMVIKQLCFVLVLFLILIPIAFWDSGTQVKTTFDQEKVYIKSDKYSMTVRYDQIDTLELTALAEPGEKVQDGYDNDIIRTGVWNNEIWGDYHICVDLDADQCVVLHLDDGRIFVFSQKDNETTAEKYEMLRSYVESAQ